LTSKAAIYTLWVWR